MRKPFALIVGLGLAAGLASPASAQYERLEGFTLGARGGVSISTISFSGSEEVDVESRTGFVGGLFANWSKGYLGFQVEGLYAQKGAKEKSGSGAIELGYIEIPVLIKLGVPLGSVKPSIFSGIQYGALVSCNAVDDEGSDDCKDEAKSADWTLPIGADLEIALGSISLWIDGRYDLGLNRIDKDEFGLDQLKNRAWSFTAGIGFFLR